MKQHVVASLSFNLIIMACAPLQYDDNSALSPKDSKAVDDALTDILSVVLNNLDAMGYKSTEEHRGSHQKDEQLTGDADGNAVKDKEISEWPFHKDKEYEDKSFAESVTLSSRYPCDHYDTVSRTCSYVRQVGTSLTMAVVIDKGVRNSKYKIHWYRHFHLRKSQQHLSEELTKDRSPWNVVIGGANNELRVSPITDTDLDYNCFVAKVDLMGRTTMLPRKQDIAGPLYFTFKIDPPPIDFGFLYFGEELAVSVREFIEIPEESIIYEWQIGAADQSRNMADLPSNMKLGRDKSYVTIKELRILNDDILTCAIYTSKNVFVAKRKFLIREQSEQLSHHQFESAAGESHRTRFKRDLFSSSQQQYGEPFDGFRLPQRQSLSYSLKRDSSSKDSSPFFTGNQASNQPFDNTVDRSQTYNNEYKQNGFQIGPQSSEHSSDSDTRIDRSLFYVEDNQMPFTSVNDIVFTLDLSRDSKLFHGRGDSLSPSLSANGDQRIARRQDAPFALPWMPEDSDNEVRRNNEHSFDEDEAKLISDCTRNSQCSNQAYCVEFTENHAGFCKCRIEYKGNGIFCWLTV